MRERHRSLRLAWTTATLLVAILAVPLAAAHGAGGAGNVEARALPPYVLWAAGAGVVALSFALVGIFLTRDTEPAPQDTEPVGAGHVTGLPRTLVGGLRLLGLLLLLVVIAAALVPWNAGAAAANLVFLGLLGLLPILAYAVGNIWILLSPFRALAGLADRMRGGSPPLAYPLELGAWPALVLLVGVMVLEALQPGSRWIGRVAIAYTGFTFAGMLAFGSRFWLAEVEVFERVFAWLSSFAPARATRDGIDWRWPGADLAERRAAGAGDASFLVGLLYAANADGFLRTGAGQALREGLAVLGGVGSTLAVVVLGLGLFLAVFWLCVAAIRNTTRSLSSLAEAGSAFAVTLVPIAVGYHLAHNLAYVVEGLPLLVDALADPLALNPSTAQPWTVLSSQPMLLAGLQIGLVVVGHVVAVVVAHRRSFNAFPSKVQAVKSEIPLTAVMVVYTLVSLWIVTAGHAGGAG